ncbi:DUF6221 family protein [Streptomyces sp. NPDC091368]|uniref:DUF6221 family protein n=1 Tax=Streptomyces sp. NPDC091368 TaxID=3365993 RepID=UPI00382A4F9A
MDDLIAFLRARLDEDADLALAASPGPWRPDEEHDEVLAVDDIVVAEGFALSGRQLRATVDHIARHGPARVLAEVKAKRKLLDEILWYESTLEMDRGCSGDPKTIPAALQVLALPYADHLDYQDTWRPS